MISILPTWHAGCWSLQYEPLSEEEPLSEKECRLVDNPTIAILLKHKHRLNDARHCARMLMGSGASVTFFCLCRERCPDDLWNIMPLLATHAACYTDNPNLAERHGVDCLTDTDLVRHIKSADWVIPF
jgi:hypothetical protein